MTSTYKFYTFTVDRNGDVLVSGPWSDRVLYRAATFVKAKQWVDAYRKGYAWASQVALV